MADSTYKILVADDDEMIRTLHAEFVRGFGYEVEIAADGIEAIAKIGLGVDLVLTDAHMPNMDGFTLVKKIRETDKTTPLIMVTTEAEKPRIIEAIKAGVNNYVVKPFTPDTLMGKIQQTLEKVGAAQPA